MENVITLSKLIGLLLLFCPPPSILVLKLKNTRNELARPVMETIYLVLHSMQVNHSSEYKDAHNVRIAIIYYLSVFILFVCFCDRVNSTSPNFQALLATLHLLSFFNKCFCSSLHPFLSK